ncbi:MAG: type II secretion system GspH family protein [Sulfuritalea sp.]|nr:type II secretion system GspH family protein [Sulfuritalea sp.]
MSTSRRQRGLTLIELVVFIIIVGVALAGVLTVLNVTAKSSADPLIRKQMLAIAEALLEEVQLQSFTWCDPDDPNAATASSAAGCTAGYLEASGPETIAAVVETRGSATTPFDNVNDFAGLSLAGPIASSTGSFSAPAGYSASIAVTPEALNGVGDATPASASLRISVTVTNGGESIVLEGYRTRHSPNHLP